MSEFGVDLMSPAGWLPLVFALVMALSMLAYVILDGYDLGVGALLAASATAFNVLKWAGAAYLVWVGVRLLWCRFPADTNAPLPVDSVTALTDLKSVFFRGFVTNVLNPKVALFFLAFVPQFIPAHASDPALTFVVLGCLFNLNGMLICMAWALAASWLAQHARAVRQGMHWLDRLAGVLFMGFGLKLALTDAPSH